MTEEKELELLLQHRAYLTERIEQLRNKIKNKKRPRTLRSATSRDYSGLWVPTACLAPYVKEWIEQGHSISMLAQQVHVSDSNIAHIRTQHTEWTRDETAEAIMMELGLPHIYADLPKVRVKRKFAIEPPPSHYFEE